jgi:hypothetical protein
MSQVVALSTQLAQDMSGSAEGPVPYPEVMLVVMIYLHDMWRIIFIIL